MPSHDDDREFKESTLDQNNGGNDDPWTHSEKDTTAVEGWSWDHMAGFVKLAIAFSVEMTSG